MRPSEWWYGRRNRNGTPRNSKVREESRIVAGVTWCHAYVVQQITNERRIAAGVVEKKNKVKSTRGDARYTATLMAELSGTQQNGASAAAACARTGNKMPRRQALQRVKVRKGRITVHNTYGVWHVRNKRKCGEVGGIAHRRKVIRSSACREGTMSAAVLTVVHQRKAAM